MSIIQEERKNFKTSQKKYLNRLSRDLQRQISSITKIYHAKLRYETSIIYQKRIQNVDNSFKKTKNLNLTILNSYTSKYKFLFSSYQSLPKYKQKASIRKALSKRMSNIGFRMIKEKERQADQLYTSLKFNQAYKKYKMIEKDINSYLLKDHRKVKKQIKKKIRILIFSAQSYIQSQIDPLLHLAEANQQRYILEAKMKQRDTQQTNSKFYKKKALSLVNKAWMILNKNNRLFLTKNIVQNYNQTAKLVNETVGKNFSVGNFALLPLRYIANIGKGISDIFVFKFGWGLGMGVAAGPLAAGLGGTSLSAELSTAYSPQGKESRISGTYEVVLEKGKEAWHGTLGILVAQQGVCGSVYFIRLCGNDEFFEIDSEPISYTNANVWVGWGPALMINIETHRFVELFGILLGQNWNITGNEEDRTNHKPFSYFSYKKAKIFKKKK